MKSRAVLAIWVLVASWSAPDLAHGQDLVTTNVPIFRDGSPWPSGILDRAQALDSTYHATA